MSDQTVDAGMEPRGQDAFLEAPPTRIVVGRAGISIPDRNLVRRVRAANGLPKRAFDVTVATLALALLTPALLLVALFIKLADGGSVLYRHKRIGRHGERFSCLKFRTMAVDADARLQKILQDDPRAAAEWALSQKLRDDPRVTPLGAFLRRTSIDELPQLVNVLRGEMSLIGPRPVTREELDRYGRNRRYYLLVRPGITGLWQVSGRSSLSYEMRVRCDRQYVEEWTWLGEIWILIMTIPALFRVNDAC